MNTKDRILKALTEKEGQFISGEFLSRTLDISRTAVWKHISRLKEEGYRIDGVSRKGYQLQGSEDNYDKSSISCRLSTTVLGNDLFFYREIDSTNNALKRMASNGAAEGTVVVAEKQSTGRGRRGREWDSKAGLGVYMSILLRPEIAPSEIQAITLAASAAICRVLEPCTHTKPGIKWPNDIFLQNRKVCGILTEMTAEPDRIHSVILGIGLNVFQKEQDFPGELKETATSLILHTRTKIARSDLVARILGEIEDLYLNFIKERSTAKFMNLWRSYSITINKDIIIYQGEKTWQAKALDVLEDGCLLVETPDGQRHTIASGEISIRNVP